MKIKVAITKVEHTDAEVSPVDFLQKLRAHFVENAGLPSGAYIDKDGKWETWEDTHGSGLYETYRKATEDEVRTVEAFKTLLAKFR